MDEEEDMARIGCESAWSGCVTACLMLDEVEAPPPTSAVECGG
jgi:hypothetical protein